MLEDFPEGNSRKSQPHKNGKNIFVWAFVIQDQTSKTLTEMLIAFNKFEGTVCNNNCKNSIQNITLALATPYGATLSSLSL